MKIVKFKILKNEKGSIFKIYSKSKKKKEIKELYFNKILPKKETFWIKHKKATCNFYVVMGSLNILTLKNNKIKKLKKISEFSDKIISIKPNNWFKIINKSKKKLIFLNFTNIKHNKNEYEKRFKI